MVGSADFSGDFPLMDLYCSSVITCRTKPIKILILCVIIVAEISFYLFTIYTNEGIALSRSTFSSCVSWGSQKHMKLLS